MRDPQQTVRGTRPGSGPPFLGVPYVYRGTEPFIPPKPKTAPQPCTADECVSPQYARSLCSRHYRRLMKHGSPDAPDLRRKENQ